MAMRTMSSVPSILAVIARSAALSHHACRSVRGRRLSPPGLQPSVEKDRALAPLMIADLIVGLLRDHPAKVLGSLFRNIQSPSPYELKSCWRLSPFIARTVTNPSTLIQVLSPVC